MRCNAPRLALGRRLSEEAADAQRRGMRGPLTHAKTLRSAVREPGAESREDV